ncbi:Fungal specific transcription [Mycena indigotica]|uniref:Fungal specific transcription n=1 Tax=Mycena indigotica TaxID=2126181 RepID=A0A8H6VT04_9AGAR|nr:Fungal specific transcription [Mycena indigotica]KAF7292814.1 Fungal specific transcription [Mycena indigotica]
MTDQDDEQSKGQTTPAAGPANPPQVRSRITVVCAECKRLKLKCDRRTPCGSCVKRDTVARCVYSPAAAEKVDLHSLNNRLIQVEQLLAQGNNVIPTQQAATPSPPVPLTPLAIPLVELHSACLAPLGLPTPAIPPRTRSESLTSRPSPRITTIPSLAPSPALLRLIPSAQRLPGRLAAGHTALTSLAAAPFPFSWFEARAYSFISGLTGTADGNATSNTPSLFNNPAKAAKEARKREREEKKERARSIFSGGANGTHNFANFGGYTALLNGTGNTPYQGYGNPAYDVPLVHTLAEPQSDPIEPDQDSLDNSEQEVDELDNEAGEDTDGLTLRPAGAHPSNTAIRTQRQPRGDPRTAFFALLCGVLALSANSAEPDELPEADLLALAKRAATEYFEPPPSAVVADKERERLQAEVDAILGMWAVGVCLMRRSSSPGEEVYVHVAQTVAYARVAGLDQETVHRLPADTRADLATKATAARKRQHQQPPTVVKMEEVEECLGIAGLKQKDECVHVLRARTWWTVCWGDILAAEATDIAPAIALGTTAQHQSVSLNQLNGEDTDLLDRSVDWSEDDFASFAGKRFGAWPRFARVLHHVHTLTGMEGASSAESIIRAWAAAEGGGDFPNTNGFTSPVASPSISSHVPAFAYGSRQEGMEVDSHSPSSATSSQSSSPEIEAMQHRAEVALLANRAILKLWMSWMAFNPSATSARTCPPTIPMQAVYGAVGAAHGIVQACRSLQALPLPVQSSSLGLLADPPMRSVFDAGIVCAHAALRYPIAVFAAGARESLATALALLRVPPQTWSGQTEGVRVLEGLARRAGVLEESYKIAGNAPKRKHDATDTQSASHATSNGVDVALREKEMQRDKASSSKEKKKRTSYPSVGIRVRPGKETPFFASGSASPVVPPPPRKGSASNNGSPSARQQDEMAYYALSQQPKAGPSSNPAQQPQSLMNAYRSRSSSISQDPRLQPPKDQQSIPMDYSVPFSAGGNAPPSSQPLEDFSRRSFGELPPPTSQQPQQGYASEAMYELQPPRAGSYDADAYGNVGSPFGSSSSGSPYNTTATSVPFGGPSPPSYSTQQPYYSNGYDAPPQPQQTQFDVGVGPSPPRQYHGHVEQDGRHDMTASWAATVPDSHPQQQFWPTPNVSASDEYNKFYSH